MLTREKQVCQSIHFERMFYLTVIFNNKGMVHTVGMVGMVVDKGIHSHTLEQEGTQQEGLQQNHLKMVVQKIQVFQTRTQAFRNRTQGVQIQKVFSYLLE